MARTRAAAAAVLAAVALLLGACPVAAPPGDQNLGDYVLHGEPAGRSCPVLDAGAAPIDFQVTLSRQSDASAAWMTLSGYSRDASWDGQVMTSTASADRVFTACSCGVRLEETITLALLSQSQAAAAGLACPPHPLDGGVPAPTPDGSVTAPAFTAQGFDAILACGELATALVQVDAGLADDGGVCDAGCLPCTTRFSLTGTRR